MIAEARELRDALVSVYRPWVCHAFESRGWELSKEVEESIDEGEHWLLTQLDVLLAEPFQNQRRGPLELFQEAMRYPTAALAAETRDPVRRDGSVEAALPGDIYDLAPASSQQLGDETWQAHLRWGASKAAAFLKPDGA